jgi:hypothetical protein
MRNVLKLVLPAFVGVVLFSQNAEAWNGNGHMTVDKLAWEQLDARQRQAVYDLLLKHPHVKEFFAAQPRPKDVSEAEWYFVIAGTWADWLRGYARSKRPEDQAIAAYHKGPQHYIDLPLILPADKALFKDKKVDPPDENIINALNAYRSQLLDPKTPDADKAVALTWLLHLVGDIHQPLHCVGFFSNEYPDGDEGGNLRWVKDSQQPINLHAYWDNLPGKESTYEAVKTNSALLTRKEYGRDIYDKELAHTKFMEWAEEGRVLAWKSVYLEGTLPGVMIPADKKTEEARAAAPELPEGYGAASEQVARRQLALAGHRMADQINAIWPRPER